MWQLLKLRKVWMPIVTLILYFGYALQHGLVSQMNIYGYVKMLTLMFCFNFFWIAIRNTFNRVYN